MAVTRLSNSGIKTGVLKYDSSLAGYPGVMPAPTAADGGTGTSATVSFSTVSGATSYTAISTPGFLTGSGTTSPVTVTGLTAGTAYTFQIRANNATGSGAYSAASNSVTPIVPTSFDLIATAQGNGSSNEITFSSIPTTYTHLQLRGTARNAGAAQRFNLYMRFNGNTSANYAAHYYYSNGVSVTGGGTSSQNLMESIGIVAGNNSNANAVSSFIIDIADYRNTSQTKVARAFGGLDSNASNNEMWSMIASGILNDTSAISSVTLIAQNGNFTSASRIALYGIKGS